MIVIGRRTVYLVLAILSFSLILGLISLMGYFVETKSEKFEVDGKIIVIDAGHGGEDPGAKSSDGLIEKDINLEIALRLKNLIEASGNKCVLTREEDKLHYSEGTEGMTAKRRQDLAYRKSIAESSKADVFISIHLNSFTQTQYYGAQTFYSGGSAESKKLAEIIQSELTDKVDKTNKRVALVRNDITILKNSKIPTVLVECGFLSNPKDAKALGTDEHLNKTSEAIFIGCMKYLSALMHEAGSVLMPI